MKKIYVLAYVPSLGELGNATNRLKEEICAVCRKVNITYDPIAYKFDQWGGEDLLKVGGMEYFVSERLKDLLQEIPGIAFQKAIIEKESYFKVSKNAYQKDIPNFYLLTIEKRLDGPEIWYTRTKVCESCGDQKWMITLEGISSTINSDVNAKYTPREVYKDTWNGEMIFSLQDPGLPIVTEEFVDILNGLGGYKYDLREAKWADR